MDVPRNRFKQALLETEDVTYGLWAGLGDNIAAEICACAGFDWLLLDGEHGVLELRQTLSCLQAVAPYPTSAIVRPRNDDPALLKQVLDVGAQSVLVPMVNSAEQAKRIVEAVRYPPEGIRGLGTSLARAARWNMVPDYVARANEEICVIVQIETREALQALPDIVSVDGVDAVFVGPSDLGASLGYPGTASHETVVQTVKDTLGRIWAAGKPAGVLAVDPDLVREYIDAGARFVGVGTDTGLLAKGAARLAASFKSETAMSAGEKGDY